MEIHIGAPDGPAFISSGPGSFYANTGHWVQNGMTFYLQNVSNGLPLTAANTLATVTMTAVTPRSGSIMAQPEPISSRRTRIGRNDNHLDQCRTGTTQVEVHVDAPNGNMFAGSNPGTYSLATGHWVRNGTTFYLQDVSNGQPLTPANTLATVRMTPSP